MRCEDVIRELAAPTGEPDPAAMAQHLAGCPECSGWARRAAQLEALWEATRPPEPAPEVWDSVWASLSRQLEDPAAVESLAPATAWSSRNGRSSQVLAHPAPGHPAAPRRTWRLAAITVLGLAQAAAILIALGLVELTPIHDRNEILPKPPLAQNEIPPGLPTPSVVRVAVPVRVEADLEEGPAVMIRMDGPAPQVVVETRPGMAAGIGRWSGVAGRRLLRIAGLLRAAGIEGWSVVAGGLGGAAMAVQEPAPGVDTWYVMLNEMESLDIPRIAAR
ncbi:MAG TPA: hypothetical protein VFF52_09765 [Isosphaeraceae bacterium]|nr:hypothetical protein [Isosphaeraceae bacterium]